MNFISKYPNQGQVMQTKFTSLIKYSLQWSQSDAFVITHILIKRCIKARMVTLSKDYSWYYSYGQVNFVFVLS